MENKIEIYKGDDNQTEIKVQFDEDTVWLSQEQISLLFNRGRTTITEHIRNIFAEGELEQELVCRKFRHTTKHGAIKGKTQSTSIKQYNLDVIISVGYRIKSRQGTQFRQWASKRLKEYLVQGYSINEKRLAQKQQEVKFLKTGIRIIGRALEEASAEHHNQVFQIFSKGLELLDDFDHQQLDVSGISRQFAVYPSYEDYMKIIREMYSEFQSDLFSKAKDDSFLSSINQIRQSFDDQDLYPTIEEKATNLLYFITKNHSFVDGNKRIAAACFIYFLEQNDALMKDNGEPVISNEALAALTLFIANSKPEESTLVKKFTISILNRSIV